MKRPMLYIFISFSFGVLTGRLFKIPIALSVALGAASIIFALIYSKGRIISHLLLYLALFFASLAYFRHSETLPPDHISNLVSKEPRKVLLKGVIADDPAFSAAFYGSEKTSFILKVDSYKGDSVWRKASGLVTVRLYSKDAKSLCFGDEMVMEGALSRPSSLRNPGVFDYSKYLGLKNIYAALKVNEGDFLEITGRPLRTNRLERGAHFLRRRIRDIFDRYLERPYSGFLKAILIGERSELDEGVKEDFIKTGTVHIIAISGLHIGLIASIALAVLGVLRIPRRQGLVLTLFFLLLYSFVAGSSPPIVRATIGFAIFTIGWLIKRDADMLNSLAAAGLFMVLWNPKMLFDPSFRLSFVSVASIIIFVPKIKGILRLDTLKGRSIPARVRIYLLNGMTVSVAAWLGSWPLVSSYFNIVSPVALIANLVVIPILFVLTAGSFIFIIAGSASSILGNISAQVLCVVEKLLFFLNHILAQLPFSHLRVKAAPLSFALSYYALLGLFFLPREIEFRRMKIPRRTLLIFLLLFFNILIWHGLAMRPGDEARIAFLDVGQGDSIFAEFPDGKCVLVDGGPGGKEGLDAGRRSIAPYLWNKGVFSIDAVIVTHFHEDHLGGLIYILKNFKIGCVIDSAAAAQEGAVYREYVKTIKTKGIRRITVREGDAILSFGGANIFILNPEKDADIADSNDNSIVLKLVYKNKAILLGGDITYKTMDRLGPYGGFLKSDILKVPHHGGGLGREDAAKDFFRMVSPKISIISAGARYESLSKRTADILASVNSVNYITKENGAITALLKSDFLKIEEA